MMSSYPPALPASLTVVSWNGDHLMALDQKGNFLRRNRKLKIIEECLPHSPDVVFIQEPGRYLQGLRDWAARKDYKCFESQHLDRTGGVVSLVKRAFALKFSIVRDEIVAGHVMALRSTRQLSFSLVNTNFSSLGKPFRIPQYKILGRYVEKRLTHAFLFGGDQNRNELDRGKYYLPTNGEAGKWAVPDKAETTLFYRMVLLPAGCSRVMGSHLGFTHRAGKYVAELDAFTYLTMH